VSGGQRQVVLGIVAVVALGGAGYMLLGRPASEGASATRPLTTLGACLACRQECEVKHTLKDIAPLTCPKCAQQAVYPWLYCETCQQRFVAQPERMVAGDPPRVPMNPICPICQSASAVTAYMVDPSITPKGDAPLPKWP
jgi:hypothetical protein